MFYLKNFIYYASIDSLMDWLIKWQENWLFEIMMVIGNLINGFVSQNKLTSEHVLCYKWY